MSKIIKPSGNIFKHDCVFTGIGEPYLYYKEGGGVIDGIGRQHINLYGKCDICNKEVIIAKIHVNEKGELYGLKK